MSNVNRRNFLKGVAGGAVVAGAVPAAAFSRWDTEKQRWVEVDGVTPIAVNVPPGPVVDINLEAPNKVELLLNGKKLQNVRSFSLNAAVDDVVTLELELLPSEVNVHGVPGKVVQSATLPSSLGKQAAEFECKLTVDDTEFQQKADAWLQKLNKVADVVKRIDVSLFKEV